MPHIRYIELFKREHNFRVQYRLFSQNEGGRQFSPFQGIRWDFGYQVNGKRELFMIYPEFENSKGQILDSETPIEQNGYANMWILNLDFFEYHKDRIQLGTKGTFNEGKPIADCEVVGLNFQKTIIIKHFNKKHQERLTFVRLLTKFNPNISLKPAKDLLDLMLDGNPIEYRIWTHRISEFVENLEELNLEYEIKSA